MRIRIPILQRNRGLERGYDLPSSLGDQARSSESPAQYSSYHEPGLVAGWGPLVSVCVVHTTATHLLYACEHLWTWS